MTTAETKIIPKETDKPIGKAKVSRILIILMM
jgi:hypothetical protein